MSSLKKQKGKVYWRSLAELADEPEFRKHLENEFPESELGEPGSVSRRRFMQLMGASMALASGSACRWEKETILPFTRRPAGMTPGIAQHYATTMELGGHGLGLLVTSREGRPTKIEGNPQHPMSLGATDAFAQASILEMYDPDRSRNLAHSEAGQQLTPTWSEFTAALRPIMQAAKADGGRGVRILSEASSSPTLARLQSRFLGAFPQAKWYEYEPISRDNERLGTAAVFGEPYRVHMAIDRARVILSLDDDFLHIHPAAVKYSRDFAAKRRPEAGAMNRLYVVESRHSNTGAIADHRLPLRSEQINGFLLALTAEVAGTAGFVAPADLTPYAAFAASGATAKFVKAVAKDLLQNQGSSIVTVGCGQPPEVHALAHQLNALLHNVGTTVLYTAELDPARLAHRDAIKALSDELHKGEVGTLVMLGGNPVYNAPAELKLAEGLAKAKTSIHLSLYRDETSRAATWHIPRAHYLESWGDTRAYDGTVSVIQPLIDPLYNGKTPLDLISTLLGEENVKSRELVHQTMVELGGVLEGEKKWRQSVHDGFLAGTAWSPATPTRKPLPAPKADAQANAPTVDNGRLELTFWQDPHVYDGRFANNGWLQELPDFMSKLTWDNAALFAPETAKALGVKHQTLVKLKHLDRELEVAAYVLPGQAPGSIAVFLGYGRTEAGHIGGSVSNEIAPVGFNTYVLRQGDASNFVSGLTVDATGTFYELATTQDHHSMDDLAERAKNERVGEIVREATLEAFIKEPDHIKEMVEHPPLQSLWKEFTYDGHRWGMAIDLTSCVGCNACVVACQAENNIPIVGKEQVIAGRSMHWLRIDRYFSGDPAAPTVVNQPMTCQQCENAPCEQVCPVAATIHSSEGLNDMVYNRCVGTRYCSNNCPYKVRRFNFFNYHKNLNDTNNHVTKMMYNPDVTVRARGVMEKCTYCVQRIQAVKIDAKNKRRPIQDGEITTACAQACPAGSIVFGDLSNPTSAVAKQHADKRSYFVLEELNTKPRTAYLARIKNPNPELQPG